MTYTLAFENPLSIRNKPSETSDRSTSSACQERYQYPQQMETTTRQLTPPPSKPTPPRRSREYSPSDKSMSPARPSYASQALSNAFSSEESVSGFLPSSFYRTPDPSRKNSASQKRNSTDRSGWTSSSSSVSLASSIASPAPQESTASRSSTPESRSQSTGAYAPMAAGFARLSKKDSNLATDLQTRGRTGSTRPSLDLEARMFSGPA